jgi:hypothetical protein
MTAQEELILRIALTSLVVSVVIYIIGEIIKEKAVGRWEDAGIQVRNWAAGIAISIAVLVIVWALLNGIWTMEIGKK